MPTNENRVKNAVAAHIAGNGYSSHLRIRAENERGPDIYAEHRNNPAQRIFVEAKGDSPGGNKTLAIQSAWGELISRITALNPNRIHGLAFPIEWENNVARLTSHIVARQLNVHYFSSVEQDTSQSTLLFNSSGGPHILESEDNTHDDPIPKALAATNVSSNWHSGGQLERNQSNIIYATDVLAFLLQERRDISGWAGQPELTYRAYHSSC
jgi:hypothetical protein